MSPRPALPAVLATVLALLVSGSCGGDGGTGGGAPTEPASPLAHCTALTSPPAAAPRVDLDPGAGDASTRVERLPGLTLPCVTGGEPVALDRLAGPAVVNLWASWCEPCRDELPVLQQYADRAAGRVHVVGVVTEDTRTRAVWFARDAGVTFPGVLDVDGRLLSQLPVGLPVTLFVDGDGRVRHVRNGALDPAALATLAAEHLGVVLP